MKVGVSHQAGDRGLHRVHPGTGLLWLASVLFAVLGTGSLIVKVCALVLASGLAIWSEGSIASWAKSLRFVVSFALFLFLAQVLSVRDGSVLFRVGVPVTRLGLLAGANMSLRFLVILASSLTFAMTTDPDALANALIRWGIPYRYGYTLILALRFVPFFRNELHIVRDAQQMRGVRVSVRSFSGIRRAIRYTFVPVLVSGLLRVDTIAMSMKGRAFGTSPRRTLSPRTRIYGEDVLVWCLSGACVGLVLLGGWYRWL